LSENFDERHRRAEELLNEATALYIREVVFNSEFPQGLKRLKAALTTDPKGMRRVILALQNPIPLALQKKWDHELEKTPAHLRKLREYYIAIRYLITGQYLSQYNEIRRIYPNVDDAYLVHLYDHAPGVKELFDSWLKNNRASEARKLRE
jgi:mRNA-degrading endonuclease YafQ of YafQ-DinJ toxin-antitoxin module